MVKIKKKDVPRILNIFSLLYFIIGVISLLLGIFFLNSADIIVISLSILGICSIIIGVALRKGKSWAIKGLFIFMPLSMILGIYGLLLSALISGFSDGGFLSFVFFISLSGMYITLIIINAFALNLSRDKYAKYFKQK